MKIDPETLIFMRRHKIAETDVYDAGQKTRMYWKPEMEKAGWRYVYTSTQCTRGHRLKNRHGQCVVCNPHSLGFAKHHRSSGIVYVAASKSSGLVKIGGTTTDRVKTLNRQSYGGVDDWCIVHKELVKETGEIEARARAAIRQFRVSGQVYRGDQREAHELFKCDTQIAVEAVKRAAKSN